MGQLRTYRGYTIETEKGFDGWLYSVRYGTKSLGSFAAPTWEGAIAEAQKLIDRDISRGGVSPESESIGELRLAVGALMERVERLEQNSIDIDRKWTGSIQGLDDMPITVTVPEGFWE